MLLHAREGHAERLGKLRDGSVRTRQPLQDAAPGRVGQRGERGVQVGLLILNHLVHYMLVEGRMQER